MKVIYVAALLMLGLPFAGVCDEPASGDRKNEEIIRFEDTKALSMEEFEKQCTGKQITLIERFENAYAKKRLLLRRMPMMSQAEFDKRKWERKISEERSAEMRFYMRTFGNKPVLGNLPAYRVAMICPFLLLAVVVIIFAICSDIYNKRHNASDCKKNDTE